MKDNSAKALILIRRTGKSNYPTRTWRIIVWLSAFTRL